MFLFRRLPKGVPYLNKVLPYTTFQCTRRSSEQARTVQCPSLTRTVGSNRGTSFGQSRDRDSVTIDTDGDYRLCRPRSVTSSHVQEPTTLAVPSRGRKGACTSPDTGRELYLGLQITTGLPRV